MSPVHGSQRQPYARPVAQTHDQWGQPTAHADNAAPSQSGYGQSAQQNLPYGAQAQPQGGYGGQSFGQPGLGQVGHGQGGQAQHHPGDDYGYPPASQGFGGSVSAQGSGYAPQFEPYVPTQPSQPRGQQTPLGGYPQQHPQSQHHQVPLATTYAQQSAGHGQPPTYAPANAASSWGQPQGHQPQHDPRGFDLGTYMPNAQPTLGGHDQGHELGHGANDWNLGGYQGEADGYGQSGHGHGEMGFGQAAEGELDQSYAEGDEQDYEYEAPSRARRPMMIAVVLAGAVVMGGGLSVAYKSILGGTVDGDPPVVKSAEAPSKVKPADTGGKRFSYTDSKIMGRLGDGAGGAATASADSTSDETGPNGTRRVSTLVVGRDGSIQPPPAAPAAAAGGTISVPGMTVVDGLGGARAPAAAATMAAVAPPPPKADPSPAPEEPAKIAVAPVVSEPAKPVTIAKAAPAATTASIEEAAAPPPSTSTRTKAAAASTSVATSGNGANGFVAVLASVPRSGSSRMDALKRFADMQQKYSSVLAGKTPDVAEANLGAKGNYHRLVVGPPGSRQQASNVCVELKSQGYSDCWVTTY